MSNWITCCQWQLYKLANQLKHSCYKTLPRYFVRTQQFQPTTTQLLDNRIIYMQRLKCAMVIPSITNQLNICNQLLLSELTRTSPTVSATLYLLQIANANHVATAAIELIYAHNKERCSSCYLASQLLNPMMDMLSISQMRIQLH